MDNKRKVPAGLKIFIAVALASAAVFAVWQTILVCTVYEAEFRLFANGAKAPGIFNVTLVVVTIIILVVFAASMKVKLPVKFNEASPLTKVFSALTAFLLLSNTIRAVLPLVFTSLNEETLPHRIYVMSAVTMVLSIPAFIYFVMIAFSKKLNRRTQAAIGMFAIAWNMSYLLLIYFDITGPINDPLHLIDEFAVIAVMLYLVYEIRFLLDDPRPNYYIAFSVFAVIFLAVSLVSNIVGMMSGALPFESDALYYIYEIAMLLYVLSRVVPYIKREEIIEKSEVVPEVSENSTDS